MRHLCSCQVRLSCNTATATSVKLRKIKWTQNFKVQYGSPGSRISYLTTDNLQLPAKNILVHTCKSCKFFLHSVKWNTSKRIRTSLNQEQATVQIPNWSPSTRICYCLREKFKDRLKAGREAGELYSLITITHIPTKQINKAHKYTTSLVYEATSSHTE